MTADWPSLGIAALATAGVILRPFRIPEYAFALAGAVLLVAFGLMPWPLALAAVHKGTDVYLFLIGMMLLAGLATREGLFDYLAALAVQDAKGSARRLFATVYGVGIVVTVFLSNDATAVVLTPAVYAAAKHARVNPLPYLFACAFIANAASFVLPISNPANLVIYGAAMPPLGQWLRHLLLPSVAAIAATYLALRWALRRALDAEQPGPADLPHLSHSGRLVAGGIVLTALVLMTASALGADLGGPTLLSGCAVVLGVTLLTRASPVPLLRHVSWGVLPLVAGLFVLVGAVFRTGALGTMTAWLHISAQTAPSQTAAIAGGAIAVVSNLMNNLPAGLIAATAGQATQVPPQVTNALLIGVDLGPNLSVTGSLATILWLVALRREGLHVSAGQFLRLGAIVMPPALLLALGALLLQP
ncbi:MAG: arsenic transporter [Rhodobacteraceae bacterium]|nr:arsenic transporter [Paracoccaceae bacterium]